MTSTVNRCPVDTLVWCFDKNEEGNVLHGSALGLPFAPVVQTSSGERLMYCGAGLNNVCQYIIAFTRVLGEQGCSEEDIVAFRNAWFTKTNRDTQRKVFYDGLCQAQLEGTTERYITKLKTTIGL